MRFSKVPLLLVLLAITVAAVEGCRTKRPPAVTSAPRSGGAPSTPGGVADGTQPIDPGPDVRPLDDEGIGQNELSDASGEGGPLADIRFDYNEATLTDEARATLDRHAVWLQARPQLRVTVEGHCDERGTVEYNLALGDRRAQAAREYLVTRGVAADRLRAVSYGKERPVDTGRDDAAFSRNRRAHFAVSR